MKKTNHLRHLLFFGLFTFMACLVSLQSCRSSQSPPAKNNIVDAKPLSDTLLKAEINIMIDSINAGVRRLGMPNKLPYGVHNVADTINYWIIDGHSARISAAMSPPEQTMWPTFFIYKGDMVMVRYRYYNPNPPQPYAAESLIYLKQGKIVHCDERRQDLNQDEMPGLLKQKPFSISTRSPEEIEKDFKEHWKAVTSYMKQYNAIPPAIANALL